jgi:2-polyprenyl-3-methyl-5-hydroxy-6-metoxy-1,4-benzoquinol methylase
MKHAKEVSQAPLELVWTPEMVARYWHYERTRPHNYFSFQVGAAVIRHFRRSLQGRVLDYGAGPGFLVDELLRVQTLCAAIEFGKDAVDELNEQFLERKGFLGAREISQAGCWQGMFDAALLVEVVEHLYDDPLRQALAKIRELLRKGGQLIITTPNNEDREKSFICSPESGLVFHRFQHVRSWTERSLSAFVAENGFSVRSTGTIDFAASVLAHRRTMSLPIRLIRSTAKRMICSRPHLFVVAEL